MKFTKYNVKVWMTTNYHDHVDSVTGEVNFTSICESAAEAFNQNFEDGPLDDPNHWIWECPAEIWENQ